MPSSDTQYPKKKVKTGGRVAGTPNKTTVKVKEAILHAFDEVGGYQYLVGVALRDPRTFCTLVGRVLPSELSGPDGSPIEITEVRRVVVGTNDPDG